MIIKCKMCGGDIDISSDKTFGTCEYCGSVMTLPKVDDEQRAAAFNRGNHFRRIGEFDKALSVYERIVQEDENDAEAHWCCALCRFGIEYVEDPATYEWLPTCHRASFDSFLDDVDYLAAVEHSDGVTRRQYQKDGAKIAEVQRGILATSQNEEPFDVFICYKESDENGNRTKDSTLAQDIYYQFTEQGRRVFFARITLEDKAGAQYEPYIFAALHSAKVMIAVGTKPEYFSAVWVKNEWSRFLSLMKKDRTKLLLPCYRDMDPYDLPEQLSVLQSYDMSKIGFIQDLIRGVNKVLDAEKKPEPVKETVVVQQSGSSNTAALLKRGNMALEDGEWGKADSFFEDVLNQDAECAEAYVGKLLAAHHEKSLESYIQTLLAQTETAQAQQLSAREMDTERIQAAVQRYVIPNYLAKHEVEDFYVFDFTYQSELSARKQQATAAKQVFIEDKLLSRAMRFAKGDYQKKLEAVRKSYFDALDQRTAAAEQEDRSSVEKIQAAYAQHLDTADAQASRRYQEMDALRERYYQATCKRQSEAKTPQDFETVIKSFQELGNYKDSAARVQECQKAAAELKEQLKKEAAEKQERLLAENRKAAAVKRKRNLIIASTVAACLAVAIAVTLLVQNVIVPQNHYKEALALMESGQYAEAAEAFGALGDYKDATAKRQDCVNQQNEITYQAAVALMNDGKFAEAAEAFAAMGNYKDATFKRQDCAYQAAVALMNDGKYAEAVDAFAALGGYKDAGSKATECRKEVDYQEAVTVEQNGGYGKAAIAFGKLGDYKDAKERSLDMWGNIAQRDMISAHLYHTVGLKSDGTVVAAGRNDNGQCDVSGWVDIVAVSAGGFHTVGLKSDGTVVAVGYNSNGQCNVSNWTDIVAISAGAEHTVGLRSDGTVVAVGYNDDGECNVSDWTDIVSVSTGGYYTVGLKSDGTVVAVGENDYGGCNVFDWAGIVAVSTSPFHTVGLKADGTVVTAGGIGVGECNVSDWAGIVAISVGYAQTVGLKADGTVVEAGDNFADRGNISGWTDIIAISVGGNHTVGVKSDGTVVAVGVNDDGQCNVSDWTDIKLPQGGKHGPLE